MKDALTFSSLTDLLIPQTVSGGAGSVNSSAADMQNAEEAIIGLHLGNSGDTLSGSLSLTALLVHGDSSDLSSATVVTDQAHVKGTFADLTTGTIALIDAPAEDSQSWRVAYMGPKRYVGIRLTKVGTHTNGIPVSAEAITVHKRYHGASTNPMVS